MTPIEIIETGERPMRPRDAEFGITIDYEPGVSNPIVVFQAMTEMLEATAELDRLFVGSITKRIEPTLILEDVEAASVTAWVRNALSAVDDDALKEFDPKQQVGKYAVRAKYKVLRFLDEKIAKDRRARLRNLQADLLALANEADGPMIPLANPIPLDRLAQPMDRVQNAKKLLGPNDTVTYRSEDEDYRLDTTSTEPVAPLAAPTIEQTTRTVVPMTLTLKRPDLLGSAMWDFKHGSQAISAHIEDKEWLDRFRAGEIAIVPGVALRCQVAQAFSYDENGGLIGTAYDIVRVHEVIAPSEPPPDLFENGG